MIDNPLFRCSISLHCIILVEPFHMTCLFFRALCPLSPATDIHGSRRNLFTFEVNDLQTFAVQLFTLGSKLDDYFLFKTNSAPKTSHKSLSATFSRKADWRLFPFQKVLSPKRYTITPITFFLFSNDGAIIFCRLFQHILDGAKLWLGSGCVYRHVPVSQATRGHRWRNKAKVDGKTAARWRDKATSFHPTRRPSTARWLDHLSASTHSEVRCKIRHEMVRFPTWKCRIKFDLV